jgi:hypothetical protein
VLAEAKFAFAVVASGANTGPAGGFGQIFSRYLTSRKPAVFTAYKGHAEMLLNAPEQIRRSYFGRYATIPPAKYLSLDGSSVSKSFDAVADPKAAGIDFKAFHDRLLSAQSKLFALHFPFHLGPFHLDPDLLAGWKYRKMEFLINSVHCFEETSGLLEGADEINMGGAITDSVGNTAQVGEFVISDDFNAGETVTYPGGHVFAGFGINTDPHWPHVYFATIALAEKDSGGFAEFLQQLWAKIKEKVEAALVAGFAAIGAAIGSAYAGIGAIVGAVIGAILGWLVSLVNNPDDMLGVKVVQLSLGAATKSYYDWAKLTSPSGLTLNVDFQSDGHYQVNCGFRLVNP